jgi:tripartite-type tricarboxylate transporter receptor subunit TctC
MSCYSKKSSTLRYLLASALCLSVWTGAQAQAQPFPNKPVKLVVTYPAGGSSDLMARIMGQKLSEAWGQPVIIESKPGAAGSIGMEYAARQPADGYTFVVGNLGPAAVNPLISKVPYNMDRDFIPVSLSAVGPNVLVVPAASPYKSLADLLAAARAKPGTINFGTSGPGSMSHLSGEMIMRQAKVQMTQIPYKGGGLAVTDLIAGQINMMVSDALPVSQHIRTGRLRALAVTSGTRMSMLPEVPTFSEAGLDGLVANNWWGVFLPAKTPKAVVDTYLAGLRKVMVDPDLKERFAALGVDATVSSQEEFVSFLAAETARYAKLVADNNIKAE